MTTKLNAEMRDKKITSTVLKKAGYISGVVYGAKIKDNLLIKVKKQELDKVYESAGESTLVDVAVDGQESIKVVIKDVQRDPVKSSIRHVDFYQVDMTKKMVAEIELNFIGESKAVKDLGAMIIKNIDKIQVECLPGALVKEIDVSIDGLNEFGDAVRMADIKLPEGMELMSETNDIVVSAIEPKEEIEQAPVEAPAVEGEPAKEGAVASTDKSQDKKE